MKNRELKTYLQSSLQQGAEIRHEKKEEITAQCKKIMREQEKSSGEERTSFWQFLSDVFRFEGLLIFGLQAGVLFLVCIQIGMIQGAAYYVPAFTPLFALAVMPALLRSQFYKMGEMEAVTRASGTEMTLAKLILAGAANLVCMTVVLCMVLYVRQSSDGIGRMILYGLVPYLVCMSALLRLIRLCKKEKIFVCAAAMMGSCVAWGVSAKALPQIYEASATGLWILLFVIFSGFFCREIGYILERNREGKLYGIIG